MKYYINHEKNITLIDENDYTPYLAERGYVEVTKEEFDAKNKEISEQKHPEEFIEQIENTSEILDNNIEN